jgi:D-arginine dehydrogenase
MADGRTDNCDILVIGGGMAGASVASELASTHRVVLVERESQPGYHTTGRSAALFSETYGPPPITRISQLSVRPSATPCASKPVEPGTLAEIFR